MKTQSQIKDNKALAAARLVLRNKNLVPTKITTLCKGEDLVIQVQQHSERSNVGIAVTITNYGTQFTVKPYNDMDLIGLFRMCLDMDITIFDALDI